MPHLTTPNLSVDLKVLSDKARKLRALCVWMAHHGKEGHLNGALSCIDILLALYYGWLNVDPANPTDPERDRFIFSKGHACTALYAVLGDKGYFPKDWFRKYAQNDSPLPSHPCKHMLPILEWSSGSLGHGLGVGTGMAYATRMDNRKARTAVLISDGECNEGSTWEAAMFAATNKLDNLLVVVDFNGVQSIAHTSEIIGDTSFAEKFTSFGWETRSVDGLNLQELHGTLNQVPFQPGKPSAIIAKTRAGAGVSFMEDQVLWHYRTPSEEDLRKAFAELGQELTENFL